MRLVLLTLSFMIIGLTGDAQQPTNTTKVQAQANTQPPVTPVADVAKKAETAPTVKVETPPEVPAATPPAPAPAPKPQNQPDVALDTKLALVLVNEMSPDQVIVFDTTGKWLDTVKSMTVVMDVGTGSIVGTFTSWKGVMKPKTPKIIKMKIKEIKSVSADIFNEKLEEVNK